MGPGGRKAPTHLRRTPLARSAVCADGTRRMKCPRRPHSLAINRRRMTRQAKMSQSTYGGHGWKALTDLRRTLIALPSLGPDGRDAPFVRPEQHLGTKTAFPFTAISIISKSICSNAQHPVTPHRCHYHASCVLRTTLVPQSLCP